jgi:hypothetical protein
MKEIIEGMITIKMKEIANQRENFFWKTVNEKCSWWQKLKLKIAIKLKIKVSFVCVVIQELPIEQNFSDELNFQMPDKMGVMINDVIYWME